MIVPLCRVTLPVAAIFVIFVFVQVAAPVKVTFAAPPVELIVFGVAQTVVELNAPVIVVVASGVKLNVEPFPIVMLLEKATASEVVKRV